MADGEWARGGATGRPVLLVSKPVGSGLPELRIRLLGAEEGVRAGPDLQLVVSGLPNSASDCWALKKASGQARTYS
jgi:hypothetical protein